MNSFLSLQALARFFALQWLVTRLVPFFSDQKKWKGCCLHNSILFSLFHKSAFKLGCSGNKKKCPHFFPPIFQFSPLLFFGWISHAAEWRASGKANKFAFLSLKALDLVMDIITQQQKKLPRDISYWAICRLQDKLGRYYGLYKNRAAHISWVWINEPMAKVGGERSAQGFDGWGLNNLWPFFFSISSSPQSSSSLGPLHRCIISSYCSELY